MGNTKSVAEAANDGIVDRISDLPDHLLCHILSFLPFHYSIRISSLSKRFRYLWKSVPTLDFWDDPDIRYSWFENPTDYANHHNLAIIPRIRNLWRLLVDHTYLRLNSGSPRSTFEEIMDNVVENRENSATIRRFYLVCSNTYEKSLIFRWIDLPITAGRSDLEDFVLVLAPRVHYWQQVVKLPCAFFSCRKLVFITLVGQIEIDEIPTDVHVFFPCLKFLVLLSICIVGGNTVNRLLSGCPRIEVFDIQNCFLLSDTGTHDVTIKNLYGEYHHLKPSRVHKDGDSGRVLSQASAILDVNGCNIYKSQITFDLLKSISNMVEELEINKSKPSKEIPSSVKFVLPNVPYNKLEIVKIINEIVGVEEMEVVKYFLKNALVLKELILCCKSLSNEMKAEILDEPRASAQCEIQFCLSG